MSRALMIVLILATGACTTRLQYDYFEPSGLDAVVSVPSQAPKNTAIRRWDDGAQLEVRSWVVYGRPTGNPWKDRWGLMPGDLIVKISFDLPPEADASFTGDRAKLEAAGSEEEIQLRWEEWTLVDGVGGNRVVAFDAPLTPRSFQKEPPRKGVVNTGAYESVVVVPERYSDLYGFALTLPAPAGEAPLEMTFTRKAADYRVHVPLQ